MRTIPGKQHDVSGDKKLVFLFFGETVFRRRTCAPDSETSVTVFSLQKDTQPCSRWKLYLPLSCYSQHDGFDSHPPIPFLSQASPWQWSSRSKERGRESFYKERVEVGTESESREQKQTEEGRSGKEGGWKWRREVGGGGKGNGMRGWREHGQTPMNSDSCNSFFCRVRNGSLCCIYTSRARATGQLLKTEGIKDQLSLTVPVSCMSPHTLAKHIHTHMCSHTLHNIASMHIQGRVNCSHWDWSATQPSLLPVFLEMKLCQRQQRRQYEILVVRDGSLKIIWHPNLCKHKDTHTHTHTAAWCKHPNYA